MRKLILLTILIAIIQSKPLNMRKSKWAVNAGSKISKRSSNGIVYDADKGFDPNQETVQVDYSTDQAYNSEIIKFTEDSDIYKTERHSYKSFTYQVPLNELNLEEGKYVLILKFCEMYFNRANKRVFDINFGHHKIIKNLDIAGKAGRFSAHDEYIEFTYKNGEVWQKDKLLDGAVQNGNLVVEFEKTEKDNPFVNGLMLYTGSIFETDFHELHMHRELWEKKHRDELRKQYLEKQKKEQAKMKKKEKIKIRNDHLDDIEEDYEEIETARDVKPIKREVPPLRELLMTPMGVVSMIGFSVASFVMIYFTFFDPYGIEKMEQEKRKTKVKDHKDN